ncbi:hypothetical protein L226DRAFT_531615 [Lentinus tigrinus ALCF2SS1-7]|uniref:uncharacterized protein n=1 Tax=Lentinus tigrinus ALCF2SS1-7 TaxID=1328758 RepID=UPI0011662A3A|nr:hypothetical protein L226DRAFT_531615 [Lentinus tigrinus ALCF2SS1-7]
MATSLATLGSRPVWVGHDYSPPHFSGKEKVRLCWRTRRVDGDGGATSSRQGPASGARAEGLRSSTTTAVITLVLSASLTRSQHRCSRLTLNGVRGGEQRKTRRFSCCPAAPGGAG